MFGGVGVETLPNVAAHLPKEGVIVAEEGEEKGDLGDEEDPGGRREQPDAVAARAAPHYHRQGGQQGRGLYDVAHDEERIKRDRLELHDNPQAYRSATSPPVTR